MVSGGACSPPLVLAHAIMVCTVRSRMLLRLRALVGGPAPRAVLRPLLCRSAAWRRRSGRASWWWPTRPRAGCSWRRTRCTACRCVCVKARRAGAGDGQGLRSLSAVSCKVTHAALPASFHNTWPAGGAGEDPIRAAGQAGWVGLSPSQPAATAAACLAFLQCRVTRAWSPGPERWAAALPSRCCRRV